MSKHLQALPASPGWSFFAALFACTEEALTRGPQIVTKKTDPFLGAATCSFSTCEQPPERKPVRN